MLAALFADLKEDEILSCIADKLREGADPRQILEDCIKGMHAVMDRYEKGEYFIADFIFAIKLYEKIESLIEPLLQQERTYVGKVVVGAVKNDIHHAGKDLVGLTLKSVGFQVFNLGYDVPSERFIEELRRTGASILCLSASVGDALPYMLETVKMVKQIFPNVKVVIGGGVTDNFLKEVAGADAWTIDLVEAAKICLKFAERKHDGR